ncbi:MAG: N-acetylglucosamine-6-phosphate deacetylase [Propionibacteriaceae bacterium]|jgi:N-acetylglucosamine-6-phosphate deacetylase|nr:N-acetylglucosamine-6-phosphate deacetylase [Propionibacteriaceae bacterium]
MTVDQTQSYTVESTHVLLGDEPKLVHGWFLYSGGRITAMGKGPCPTTPDAKTDLIIAPGFVDVHCHGGGGASFTEGPEAARQVIATHLERGTTSLVASLVSAEWGELMRQADALKPLVESGELLGVHLEGPWLAPSRKGAHALECLTAPTPAQVADVVARKDFIKMVTIAPELDGAIDAIEELSEAGVMCAIGHTEADFTTTVEAIEAGARGATHLFNAMPDLHHRDPGPVLAILEDPRVFCELIVDGHHVDLHLALTVLQYLGSRAVLITDAMAAAGLGDGSYTLGGLPVDVTDGVARLADDPSHAIAGSTIRLTDAAVKAVGDGVTSAQSIAAASRQPADYLGFLDVGRIRPGARADFLAFRPSGKLVRVVRGGNIVA